MSKTKKFKALKVIGIIGGVLVLLALILFFVLMTHTQIIVGALQKLSYGDAPLDYESFTLSCKVLVGNYIRGSIFISKDELSRYNNILHVTGNYPSAFLLGSEYRHDMNEIHNALNAVGSKNILVDPFAEYGEVKPHCFMANERVDLIAKEAFDWLINFLNVTTDN